MMQTNPMVRVVEVLLRAFPEGRTVGFGARGAPVRRFKCELKALAGVCEYDKEMVEPSVAHCQCKKST